MPSAKSMDILPFIVFAHSTNSFTNISERDNYHEYMTKTEYKRPGMRILSDKLGQFPFLLLKDFSLILSPILFMGDY